MKNTLMYLIAASCVISGTAFAGQMCYVKEEFKREIHEETVGNEVITRAFWMKKFYVIVDGDDSFLFGPRGPFNSRELAEKDRAECEKLTQSQASDELFDRD
jgi:hypothetical protein